MFSPLVTPPLLSQRSLPRVLIVDDEASVRLGCVMALKADGWQAEGEGSSTTALRRLTEGGEKFDVLVLDYAIPELDGLGLTAALDAKTRPPILLASAHADGAVALAALRMGIWDFQAKPLIPEELRRRVRRLYTRTRDASQPKAWIARALEHCQRAEWIPALETLRECPAEQRPEPMDLLLGLISQIAGDEAGAHDAFTRARWWPNWYQHDAEIWTELARRLG